MKKASTSLWLTGALLLSGCASGKWYPVVGLGFVRVSQDGQATVTKSIGVGVSSGPGRAAAGVWSTTDVAISQSATNLVLELK